MKRGKSKKILAIALTMLMVVAAIAPTAAADITAVKPSVGEFGQEVWATQFGWIESGYATGGSTPPLVSGDYVYVGHQNQLIKMDKSTGKVLIRSDLISEGGIDYNNYYAQTAPVASADGNTIYLAVTSAYGSGGAGIAAFDAENLQLKWLSAFGNDGSAATTPILVEGDNIYAGTSYITYNAANNYQETIVRGYYFALDAEGEIVWEKEYNGDSFNNAGATIDNGKIYFGGELGRLYVLNAADGTDVKTVETSSSQIRSTVQVDGDFIYYTNATGELYKTHKSTYASSSVDLGFNSSSTPVIYGDSAYVGINEGFGSQGKIKSVDLNSLNVNWTVVTDGAQQGDMLLYAGGQKGKILYATINDEKGGIFAVEMDKTGAVIGSGYAFIPSDEKQNYSSSQVVLNDGDLYYKNDLNIFRVGEYQFPEKAMIQGLQESQVIKSGEKITLTVEEYQDFSTDSIYTPTQWSTNPTGVFTATSSNPYIFTSIFDTTGMAAGEHVMEITFAELSMGDRIPTGRTITHSIAYSIDATGTVISVTSTPVPDTGSESLYPLMTIGIIALLGVALILRRSLQS